MKAIKEQLRLDSKLYYYERDKNSRPIVTVCIAMLDGNIARGISICSNLDQPNKKSGKNIALGLATKALVNRKNSETISRERTINVLERLSDQRMASGIPYPTGLLKFFDGSDSTYYPSSNPIHKSTFNPTLWPYEKEIIEKNIKFKESKI